MKRMRELICLILSIFLGTNFIYGNNAYAAELSVESFVKEYFEMIDSSFSQLKWDSNAAKYFEGGIDNFDYVILDTNLQYRALQISDLTFSNYNSILKFSTVRKEKDIYTVTVTKDTVMYYSCLNRELSEELFEHTLTIREKQSGVFYVIEDTYADELRDEYLDKENELELKAFCEKVLEKAKALSEEKAAEIKRIRTDLNDINSIDENTSQISTQSSSFSFHSYDRTAAKNYAYQYVLSPNSNYANFESSGGNCTNFTSQCIKAGGICADKTGNYKWYYTSSSDRSTSWAGANYFRNYYRNNVGSSSIKGIHASSCTFSKTRLGDLIQNVNDSGTAKHTMFISSAIYDNWASSNPWAYKYDVGICQNSTSSSGRLKNVPLSSRSTSYNREYIHITGSYY